MGIRAQFVVNEEAKSTATILILIRRKPAGYVVMTSCEIVIDKVTGSGSADLCLSIAA